MKRTALALLTAVLAATTVTPAFAASNFRELREENLEKSAVDFDQLRQENLDKVDFDKLRRENLDKSAVDFDQLRQENLDIDYTV
jgi:predicted transcriptional regulator